MNKRRYIWCFLVMMAIYPSCGAQITFRLKALPQDTPQGENFYLAGTFNNWNASSPQHQFLLAEDGSYYLKIGSFIQNWSGFLVTRGDWETAEIDKEGLPLLTRKLSNRSKKGDTVDLKVANWADLHLKKPKGFVNIRIESVPKSTPPDAPIYITGNFNGWTPGDKRFQMKELEDGNFSIQIPLYWSKLEYKYSRGNWHTVEGKAYGRPRLDRVRYFNFDSNSTFDDIVDSITHWEDLSSRNFNPYTLILIMAAIQGFILILIVNSYENNNRIANKYLSILIALISFALLFRVVIYDREVYHFFPRFSLLPDLVYFLYAPLFLVYVRKLLNTDSHKRSPVWWHFVPFALQILFYIIFFLEPLHVFIVRNLSQIYARPLYIVIGGLALVYNIWYWSKIKSIISKYLHRVENTFSEDQNVVYLKKIMIFKGICLFFWTLTYMIGAIGMALDFNLTKVTIILVDVTWVVFSLTVYLLGYFAIRQPEIFKIDIVPSDNPKNELTNHEIAGLTTMLETAMEKEKLYLDSSLTLPELSSKLDYSLHEVSRAINEGFQKNFRDFINYYRVREFIKRAHNDEIKTHTFLGLAMEVGFNSKSSFNRSFRKMTGKSPREYFKQ